MTREQIAYLQDLLTRQPENDRLACEIFSLSENWDAEDEPSEDDEEQDFPGTRTSADPVASDTGQSEGPKNGKASGRG